MDHPHLHCIVPGGGLAFDGSRWISTRDKFFVPVKVLSRLFRGKFLAYLKKAYHDHDLKCIGDNRAVAGQPEFQIFLDELYEKEWVVYCKPPFGSPEQVVEYLGRYTHKVAISNNRIIKIENGKVTFYWRDYRCGKQNKIMTEEAFEFIRRFMLHILPDNFVKIRYYGLLSNRNRNTKLKKCQEVLGVVLDEKQPLPTSISWEELIFKLTGSDPRTCPCCAKGRMITRQILHPKRYVPPEEKIFVA